MKDLTATMDITMTAEGEEGGAPADDAEFPGTAEAMKESMKAAEDAAAADGTSSSSTAAPAPAAGGAAPPPPTVVVEDEKAAPGAPPRPTAGGATPGGASPGLSPSPTPSGRSTPTPGRHAIPLRPALMDRPSDDLLPQPGDDEKDLRKKEKKRAGLTKEQREQLAAYERERARIRKERVDELARKLLDRVSVWTETDKGADVTRAFQEKTRLEVENLKMESFGLDILHAIGATYVSKATALLRSQKMFGISGFFSRIRDKGTLVKETWNTISSAIDAQQTMEEMARLEEKGGEDWTDERKMEYERRVTGKILTAAWRGSKFEIQSVLREVCDTVLNDKKVSLGKRLERAEALVLIGDICNKVRVLFFLLLSSPAHLLPSLYTLVNPVSGPESIADS